MRCAYDSLMYSPTKRGFAWSTFTAAAAPLWVLAVGFATILHLTTVL